MSTEEREQLKAELVEAVRTHLVDKEKEGKSLEKRKINLTVGVAISFLVAFFGGVWSLRGGLDDLKSDLKDLRNGQNEIHLDLKHKVSVGTFGSFAFDLQRDNPMLKVPRVSQPTETTAANVP